MARELQRSISALYQTFGAYRAPKSIDACPCCVGNTATSRLHSRSLPELTSSDLAHYSNKAMTTWGTQADFKHFLPRILELLALDEDSGIYLDILLEKVEYADYSHWPNSEKEAIQEFIFSLGSEALSKYPFHIAIDELVLSLARSGSRLHEFLANWLDRQDHAATHHFADFVHSVSFKLDEDGKPALIDTTSGTAAEIRDWLVSVRVSDFLEEAFIRESNSELSNSLSDAEQQISWMRSASRK